MKSIGAIRVNRAFTLTLLILTITASNNNTPPSSASAFHFFAVAKFYLKFNNRLSYTGFGKRDEVMLDCEKLIHHAGGGVTYRPLPVEWITQNSDWGFRFKTSWEKIEYDCKFHCLGINGEFSAFVDTPKFEDELCGGRHCAWMFTNDGLFLYNLKDKRYHKRISFLPPPNDGVYSFKFRLENGNNNTSSTK